MSIRKLAPHQLEEARKVVYFQSLQNMRQLYDEVGREIIDQFKTASPDSSASPVATDPLLAYDRLTLIESGVTSWTFDVPADVSSYEDLDEETQVWLATEILKLAKPALYQTTDEAEAERKNA